MQGLSQSCFLSTLLFADFVLSVQLSRFGEDYRGDFLSQWCRTALVIVRRQKLPHLVRMDPISVDPFLVGRVNQSDFFNLEYGQEVSATKQLY